MQVNLRKPELPLDAGEVLTLDDANGTRILARTGTVWVTEEGGSEDHFVGPGHLLIVTRPGRTVVQAIRPSRIALCEGADAANVPR